MTAQATQAAFAAYRPDVVWIPLAICSKGPVSSKLPGVFPHLKLSC